MSRKVLENYLSRAISMEGLLDGRGDDLLTGTTRRVTLTFSLRH